MVRKQGLDALDFGKISERIFPKYILAIQKCADRDYARMIDLITSIFPK